MAAWQGNGECIAFGIVVAMLIATQVRGFTRLLHFTSKCHMTGDVLSKQKYYYAVLVKDSQNFALIPPSVSLSLSLSPPSHTHARTHAPTKGTYVYQDIGLENQRVCHECPTDSYSTQQNSGSCQEQPGSSQEHLGTARAQSGAPAIFQFFKFSKFERAPVLKLEALLQTLKV